MAGFPDAVTQIGIPREAARALYAARRDGVRLAPGALQPADQQAAYAIQDATLAALGTIGGWKVGARGPNLEPHCAPLPPRACCPTAPC